jgi:transposase
MPGKKIDEMVRQKIVEAHGRGLSMRTIAKEFGVGLSSVSRIVKETGTQQGQRGVARSAEKTERQKRIEALEKRIEEVEAKLLRLEAEKRWQKM